MCRAETLWLMVDDKCNNIGAKHITWLFVGMPCIIYVGLLFIVCFYFPIDIDELSIWYSISRPMAVEEMDD